ncbi:hypothetical protein [Nostoc sp. DedSLP04]|uniref:hypothetical protein n=1 Tax=Nostoc sp. DedSLP04 TaxID=3075401 RepID=UPI002AD1D466|nr:hypothetical protein [Nostoc sp. DedSLP04]MDZ8035805.1 hypothetical protein [Nostoc sp. DedSLP04]
MVMNAQAVVNTASSVVSNAQAVVNTASSVVSNAQIVIKIRYSCSHSNAVHIIPRGVGHGTAHWCQFKNDKAQICCSSVEP